MLCKLQSSSLIGQCAGHVTRFLKSYDFTPFHEKFVGFPSIHENIDSSNGIKLNAVSP
jgi:hypothetical protein